jgi:hypothetical protein
MADNEEWEKSFPISPASSSQRGLSLTVSLTTLTVLVALIAGMSSWACMFSLNLQGEMLTNKALGFVN